MNPSSAPSNNRNILIMKLLCAVEMICIGALSAEYVCDRLKDSLSAEPSVVLFLYLVFMLCFIAVSVPHINIPEYDRITVTLGVYHRLVLILALIALASVMTPNPIGFLISVIVWLFFGLAYRLDIYFWNLSIPLVVRLSLCIAGSALFLTAFCFLVRLLFVTVFPDKPLPDPKDAEEELP